MVKENDTRKVVRRERVFSNRSIKQRFGSIARARQIAERNNMELDDLIQVGRMHLWACCVKYDAESRNLPCICHERDGMGHE